MSNTVQETPDKSFPCKECGAFLTFLPGSHSLTCQYCNTINDIEVSNEPIEELDYLSFISNAVNTEAKIEIRTVKCNACGADTSLKPNVAADDCAFCGSPLVVNDAKISNILKPKSVLPFKIEQKEGLKKFKDWIDSLWFAPGKLKKMSQDQRLTGMYMPYWTYDSTTITEYNGYQGIHYHETEHYEDAEGKRQTRTITRTQWYPASGVVQNHFDDVLVLASDSLPREYADALEPWDLHELVPYADQYLSGFKTETYHIDVKQGFDQAKNKMEPTIISTIHQDIGGNEQKIDYKSTNYNNITFKHTLLPVWISAYRYNEKSFRFLINGRTGEVKGERPYSTGKITGAIITGLLVLAAFYLGGVWGGLTMLIIFLILLFAVFK